MKDWEGKKKTDFEAASAHLILGCINNVSANENPENCVCISGCMHVTSRNALTEMSAININAALMKCHLDLGVQDLAYRFNAISIHCVKYFH